MSERLRFGTAGLRGALGDGPNRMNVQVVWQAATAVARWLPAGSLVIIGHDARHGSADFAGVSARVLLGAGHRVQIFDRVVPTPVVAYAVGRSEAAAGVMVTASHNPAADNGYKVYAADGGQILPDDAHAIEAIMDTLGWPDRVDATIPEGTEWLGDDVIDAYMAQIGRPRASRSLRLVYSAMHGVGGELCVRALESAGHEVHPVPEQQQPDPDFPTASFPNPEEPGTLDLAFALADDVDADLVLANDPDADRLAVAVRRDGAWTRLTGDEIGILLGDYLLARTSGPRAVVTTIVSSSLLAKIAAAAGVKAFTVLTGFKWLAHAAAQHPELEFVLGYEEALGYSVDLSIRDKDGISAALVVAELAAELRTRGESLDDALDRIYSVHGVHVSGQVSKWFEGDGAMQQMTALMERLRATPLVVVGDASVEETRDLVAGNGLPPSDVLIYSLDGGRLIIRPSGTEPKVKAYVEAVAPTRPEATRRLGDLLTAAAAVLET